VDVAHAGDVSRHAGKVRADLPTHLGFVDELRREDARNRPGGLCLNRGPVLCLLQVERQVISETRVVVGAGR